MQDDLDGLFELTSGACIYWYNLPGQSGGQFCWISESRLYCFQGDTRRSERKRLKENAPRTELIQVLVNLVSIHPFTEVALRLNSSFNSADSRLLL